MPDEAFRLLIADDEYWVRHAIETLIDWPAYGFECLPAAQDGEDAWEKIRALRPHIVLLDVNMPFLSGIELTERLHQQYPEIAVLMLSGYSEYAYVREAMRNGAIDYLLKPVERDKLLTALSLATGHLLQRQAERQKLDALREKSELAISLLKDRELSQLLQTAGKDAADPRTLFYELQFAGYHLVQIRMLGLRMDAEGIYRLKGRISRPFEAREKLFFHLEGSRGTFYGILDMEEAALLSACEGLKGMLQGDAASAVMLMISNRKSSFRQLQEAVNEIRHIQLLRPCLPESCVVSAFGFQDPPVKNRITKAQRRELEAAAKNRAKASFWRTVYGDIGLKQCQEQGWLHVELLHTLSALGHLLQSALPQETTGSRAIALDHLMELMLVAADHFNPEEACSILEEMGSEAFDTPQEGVWGDSMKQTIRQVRAYIAENYADDLSLAFLARRYSVDDAYLSRSFKQATGENLMLYIARVRIEKAREYIAKGSWSLSEIADMTGYDDYAYFNRVFRKIIGKSPSAYREECVP